MGPIEKGRVGYKFSECRIGKMEWGVSKYVDRGKFRSARKKSEMTDRMSVKFIGKHNIYYLHKIPMINVRSIYI